MDNIMPLLQTSLILGLKTDNMIIDTLTATILLYFFKKIYDNLGIIVEKLKNIISFSKKVKSEYVIQGTVSRSNEFCYHSVNFPEEYKAIMYKITKLGIDIENGKKFNNIDNRFGITDSNHVNSMFSYSINTNKEIKLLDNIYVKQLNVVDKSNDLKSSIEFYNLSLYSYTLSFNELRDMISDWLKEYKTFVKEYNDGEYYYFSYVGKKITKPMDKNNFEHDIKFESHIFNSNKTFNNIFFDQKDVLIKRIDYFLNHKEEYIRLGIPYTLGLLFYGDPGCGKTSAIKAIANYTKRHIVEIPLSKIKTCGELKRIFFNEIINERYVPSNKKIIVLEDIDCMGNIVKKRNPKQLSEQESNEESFEEIKNNDKKDDDQGLKKEILDRLISSKYSEEEDDKLTLSYILNLIDGVLEQPGRILIITSNYPEKLDEALIRPGRIDSKINFSKCSKEIMQQIIEFYYNQPISESNYNKLSDSIYTPAEIIQSCFLSETVDDFFNKNIIK